MISDDELKVSINEKNKFRIQRNLESKSLIDHVSYIYRTWTCEAGDTPVIPLPENNRHILRISAVCSSTEILPKFEDNGRCLSISTSISICWRDPAVCQLPPSSNTLDYLPVLARFNPALLNGDILGLILGLMLGLSSRNVPLSIASSLSCCFL